MTTQLETFEIEEIAAREEFLEETARLIRAMHTQRRQLYHDIGTLLLKTKAKYPLHWLGWVKSELPFSHDTATRLMRVAEKLPRPENAANELPKTTAYALTKAPSAVRNDALALGVSSAAAVQLLTTAYRARDETDEYAEMVMSGGIDTQDGFIAFAQVTPAYVREYRKDKQAARFISYSMRGMIKRVGKALVIRGADIPADLANGRVEIVIRREIEK